jgi:hypothetical protein
MTLFARLAAISDPSKIPPGGTPREAPEFAQEFLQEFVQV